VVLLWPLPQWFLAVVFLVGEKPVADQSLVAVQEWGGTRQG
jgi:hypothetical protein